jgi:ankyrin repeat protein
MQQLQHSRARHAGADVHAVDAEDGDSALHWAVFQGQEHIVRMLLQVQPQHTACVQSVP